MLDARGKGQLYLWVTKDKYQLPIAVCDTAEELAKVVGITARGIYSAVSLKWKNSAYVKVEYSGEEDED